MLRISEGPVKLKLAADDQELRALSLKLRLRPKGFEHAPSYKAWVATDGNDGWDGYISPIRPLGYGQADCLRGHKDKLVDTARKLGLLVDLSQCLKSPFEGLSPDDIPDDLLQADFILDMHQRATVAYWLSHGMGVSRLPVNAGKTGCFAAAAAMIWRRYEQGRILYVTQSERLVRQAYKNMRDFLPNRDITQYGGGKKDKSGKHMVVATVAMLNVNRPELLAEHYFNDFLGVFMDESHHAAAATSVRLLMGLPCFFRFGASDSKRESDPAAANKIEGLLGPIRYNVSVDTYINLGRSAKPTLYLVENPDWNGRYRGLPHQAEPNTSAWALVNGKWEHGTYLGPVYERDEEGQIKTQTVRELDGTLNKSEYDHLGRETVTKRANWVEVDKPVTLDGFHSIQFDGQDQPVTVDSRYCVLRRVIDKAITSFKERNQLIVAWARYYSQERRYPTLVVCTRTMHILILQALIQEALGEKMVQVLFSDHTPRQRDEAFDWFRGTPGGVLISPLLKEGVSINEIRGGVIADYMASWEAANQIIGRFIRKKQGENEAHITFFIDVQHPSLRSGSRAMFHKLFDIRGYTFVHPCLGPDTIGQAKVFERLD